MRVEKIIWLDAIVEKLAAKHQVVPDEFEEVLYNKTSAQALILSARDMAKKERKLYGRK